MKGPTIGEVLLAAERRLLEGPGIFRRRNRDTALIRQLMCVMDDAHDAICDCGDDAHQDSCALVKFVRKERSSVPLFSGGRGNESIRSGMTRYYIEHRPEQLPHGLLVHQFPDGETVYDPPPCQCYPAIFGSGTEYCLLHGIG